MSIAVLLILLIWGNFSVEFEDDILDIWAWKKPWGGLAYSLYYAIPYYITTIICLYFEKRLHFLKTRDFWIKSLSFLAMAGFAKGFYWHQDIIKHFSGPGEAYFLNKVVNNLIRLVLYGVPMLIVKYYYDRGEKGLFGLRFDAFDYRPYFFMLLIMVPLITAASFLPSFQNSYPRISPWLIDGVFGLNQWQITLLFELSYGFNFTFIELMFRGALVVGMVKILGKDAILPMAVTYCVLHFGKPMGEAISSIFGGYILGIIAYRTKSILGGVTIHIGVAWLMEVAAFIQHYGK